MRLRLRRSLFPAAAAAVCAVAVAACGGSSNTADHTGAGGGAVKTVTETVTEPASTRSTTTTTTNTGPQTNTTATKTSTTPAAVGNPCKAADLSPRYLGSNGAAGTIVLGFALKNTGGATCHTYGWPGVEFLSASGAALPTNATRTTGDLVGSTPANVVTIAPGDEASFRMVTSDVGTGGGSCPTASMLQIYAPNDTVSMTVAVPGIAACGKATLSPMMAGVSAFARQGGGGGQSGIGSGGSDSGAGGSGGSGASSSAGSGSGSGTGTTTGNGGNGGSGLSGSSE